jgi:deoxyribonuclease-4
MFSTVHSKKVTPVVSSLMIASDVARVSGGRRLQARRRIPAPDPQPDRRALRRGLLVGVHVSTAGGLLEGLKRARALRMTAIQLFTSSPRQWAQRPLLPEEATGFRAALARAGVRAAFAHDSYLVRLGHCDRTLLGKSLAAFLSELERSRILGLDGVVTHPAAYPGCDRREALRRIAESLNQIAARQRGRGWPRILLETTAGHGDGLCCRFEELAELLEQLEPASRFGVCLDTSHVFAAGYDLRTPTAYRETWRAFDRTIGLERLHLIHANDSQRVLGSRRDRHAHIGEGELGLRTFRLLMRDPVLAAIPKVIETPKKRDGVEMDPLNLATLRRLAGNGRDRRTRPRPS